MLPPAAKLADRIDQREFDLLLVTAPAGFGKRTFATELASRRKAKARCDAGTDDLAELAKRVIEALGAEEPTAGSGVTEARASYAARDDATWAELAHQLWIRPPRCASYFVFDNLEDALERRESVVFLSRLLSGRPEGRRLILCSRVPLPKELSRHVLPHRSEVIKSGELRVAIEDVGDLLGQAGASAKSIQKAYRITEGWPIAVQLMARFAREQRLESILEDAGGSEFEGLLEYLAHEYFESLAPGDRSTLVAVIAIPEARSKELGSVLATSANRASEVARDSPFIHVTADGKIEAHPLLRALVVARYQDDVEMLAERAIVDCVAREDHLRAAEIAMHYGQRDRAAERLSQLPTTGSVESLPRLARLVDELGAEAIVRRPSLWYVAAELRRFAMPLSDLLAEARRVFSSLPRTTDARLRSLVAIEYARLLSHSGTPEKALSIISEMVGQVVDDDLRGQLELVRAEAYATMGSYEAARRVLEELPVMSNSALQTHVAGLIEATILLRSGDYEDGKALLIATMREERRDRFVSGLLLGLSNLAFEAWFAGDDECFETTNSEIRALLLPGLEKAWAFWFKATAGDPSAVPDGFEPITMAARGYLFLATKSEGLERVEFVRRAVQEADAGGDAALKVIARIAAAEYDRVQRDDYLVAAAELVADIDIPAFREAVEAYASGATECGPAFDRFINRCLRRRAEAPAELLMSIISGRVMRGGNPIDLPARELAVLTFMALVGRPVTREEITDAVWPDLDADAGTNNLRVVVHRLRKKLGDGTVVFVRDGYCLGAGVAVDLVESEAFVHAASTVGAVAGPDRKRLASIDRALSSRLRGELMRYDWFVSLDHRLGELRREIDLTLARDAAGRGDYAESLESLAGLLQDDPSDEAACELALAAMMARGDIQAAKRQLQRFEDICKAEGDDLAPRRLRAVFDRLVARVADSEPASVPV